MRFTLGAFSKQMVLFLHPASEPLLYQGRKELYLEMNGSRQRRTLMMEEESEGGRKLPAKKPKCLQEPWGSCASI